MDLSQTLMYLGLFLVLAGAVINIFPRSIAWFGHLPGDLHREQGAQRKVVLPITSLLIVGLVVAVGVLVLWSYFPPH